MTSSGSEKIFPSIPYFPGIENKKQKYVNAPVNALDSEILSPKMNHKIGRLLNEYLETEDKNKKTDIARNLTNQLVSDPLNVDFVFNYLFDESSYDSNNSQNYLNLISSIDKNIFKASLESKVEMSPELCFHLVTQACESRHPKKVETLLSGLLSKEKDPKEIISVLYETTTLGLISEDEQMLNYLLRVFNYDTNILKADSELSCRYALNILADDDESLKKFMELDAFSEVLMPYINAELYKVKSQVGDFLMNKVAERKRLEIIGNHVKEARVIAIIDYYEKNNSKSFEAESEDIGKFPYTLAIENGPVKEMTLQLLAKMGGIKDESELIKLPGEKSRLCIKEYDEKSFLSFREGIIEAIENYEGEERELDLLEEKTVLDYLRPQLASVEEFGNLSNISRQLRKELQINPKRSISVNGTEILITDSNLCDLGFKSILYKYTSNKPEMEVTISLGENKFLLPFKLDKNKQLVDFKNGEALNKGNLKADYASAKWMEAVVLSHLKEFTCSEKLSKKNIFNGDKAILTERDEEEFMSRVGHLRSLPSGENFSDAQVELAMVEQGWNLLEINEKRTSENMGKITYVRIVDQMPIGTHKKPDKFKSSVAMNDLNLIINRNDNNN